MSDMIKIPDVISRQAVLDMANTWTYNFCDPEDEWQAMKEIRDLPSVQDEIAKAVAAVIEQPEIILCKDCKHRQTDDCPMCHEEWIEYDDDGYIEHDYIVHDNTKDDGFCDRGDKKDDD